MDTSRHGHKSPRVGLLLTFMRIELPFTDIDYNNYINKHICSKLENGDTKPLYRFIANKQGSNNTIKKLDGCPSADDMAESFAKAFSSVFTIDDGLSIPTTNPGVSQNSSIKFDPKGILKQLEALDPRKGAGPDNLSPALFSWFRYKRLRNAKTATKFGKISI